MIDGFTADRPVLVNRFDRKVYLANSKALEIAGIAKGSPDPAGVAVLRDQDGEPTGAIPGRLLSGSQAAPGGAS